MFSGDNQDTIIIRSNDITRIHKYPGTLYGNIDSPELDPPIGVIEAAPCTKRFDALQIGFIGIPDTAVNDNSGHAFVMCPGYPIHRSPYAC